jgi:hypothetical protein
MKTIALLGLVLSLQGCLYYGKWQESLASADLTDQRAGIAKLYRQCLEKNTEVAQAKANCEHYTQALYSMDMRGMK